MIESLVASFIATAHAQSPELPQDFDASNGQAWGRIHNNDAEFDRGNKPALPENWQEMTQEEKQAWKQKNRPGKKLGQRFHNRPELPDNWVDMSDEERHAWMEAQLEEKLGIELPENWQEITQDEHRDWMRANAPKPTPPNAPDNWDSMTNDERRNWMQVQMEEKLGVELPDNWSEMTRKEHREWFEANDISLPRQNNGLHLGQRKAKNS